MAFKWTSSRTEEAAIRRCAPQKQGTTSKKSSACSQDLGLGVRQTPYAPLPPVVVVAARGHVPDEQNSA
jgi:hypothetical protein